MKNEKKLSTIKTTTTASRGAKLFWINIVFIFTSECNVCTLITVNRLIIFIS